MKLKERIVKALFGNVIKQEVEKSSRQIVSHVGGLGFGDGILPEIDFEIFNQMYEQTSWVRAVVGVIRKAVTARGYSLVPTKQNPDHKNAEILTEFFANCNPNDTFLELLDDITRDDYVFGNAFLEVVYGTDGKPKELWNLDATTMRVKADDHGTILSYIQVPRFGLASTKTGRVEFEAREVIHFKMGSKGATLYGLSPLASLILPVTVDKFAQIYNRAFFINGAKVRGAYIMKDAPPEQVERNREYLNVRAKNPDMAHSDLVLEGDVDFKQIGVNQKDMEFLELREFTRNEILAVYGVPPSKVSIIETGNIGAGTGEHQTQTFYEETILPYQMRLAEKITKHIIRKGFGIADWAFQFNKRAIDEQDQANIFNIYLQNGVFSPEEVRRIVAPRMPELEKSLNGHKAGEVTKGKIDPRQAIVDSTRTVVALENRFARALERVFRNIKDLIASQLPSIARPRLLPTISKVQLPFEQVLVRYHDIAFKQYKIPDALKQLDDLEAIVELIDQEGIARVVEKYSLEAARRGLDISARRASLKDVDKISLELEEILRNNALDLAGNISESIKASLRQSLIEGLAANETIQDLRRRIEDQLDSFATVNVRPVIDVQGNLIRSGTTRRLPRSSAAEIIARTEANRAYNQANLDALKQAEVSEVVFTLASDACPECRAVSESIPGSKLGKSFPIEQAEGIIPVHPNCFPGKVPVFTPAGWKPISQLRIGEEVLTHNLRFRRVLQTMSHLYSGEMVRLAYHSSDWRGEISCTPNHPFLTAQGEWKEARHLKPEDRVLLLANQCGACSNPVPYWRRFCSKRCVAVEEWKRPGHRDVVANKARDQMLNEYANGKRDPQKILEKAHAVVRRLSSLGLFPNHLEPYWVSGNTASKKPEIREKIRQSKLGEKNWMHGRKGPLHHLWRGGKITYRGKDWLKVCRGVKERDSFHCMACGISERESIEKFRSSLQVNHIIPYRIKPDNDPRGLMTVCVRCHKEMDSTLDRLIYNDTHQFKKMKVTLVCVEHFKAPESIRVFNLHVEEDESYIAKGFLVHNCRCTWVTQT